MPLQALKKGRRGKANIVEQDAEVAPELDSLVRRIVREELMRMMRGETKQLRLEDILYENFQN